MLIVLAALAGGLVSAVVQTEIPADPVQQFLQRQEPRLVHYRAIRRLEAHNKRFNASGWLKACAELGPYGKFAFQVLAEGGSGYIRDRVLKKALETEREAWSTGEIDCSAVTPPTSSGSSMKGDRTWLIAETSAA